MDPRDKSEFFLLMEDVAVTAGRNMLADFKKMQRVQELLGMEITREYEPGVANAMMSQVFYHIKNTPQLNHLLKPDPVEEMDEFEIDIQQDQMEIEMEDEGYLVNAVLQIDQLLTEWLDKPVKQMKDVVINVIDEKQLMARKQLQTLLATMTIMMMAMDKSETSPKMAGSRGLKKYENGTRKFFLQVRGNRVEMVVENGRMKVSIGKRTTLKWIEDVLKDIDVEQWRHCAVHGGMKVPFQGVRNTRIRLGEVETTRVGDPLE